MYGFETDLKPEKTGENCEISKRKLCEKSTRKKKSIPREICEFIMYFIIILINLRNKENKMFL